MLRWLGLYPTPQEDQRVWGVQQCSYLKTPGKNRERRCRVDRKIERALSEARDDATEGSACAQGIGVGLREIGVGGGEVLRPSRMNKALLSREEVCLLRVGVKIH